MLVNASTSTVTNRHYCKIEIGNAEELREVLVSSITEEIDLTLQCGKVKNWDRYYMYEHWTMLEFAHNHANRNLIDLCELFCATSALDYLEYAYKEQYNLEGLIKKINSASQSRKFKNLQHNDFDSEVREASATGTSGLQIFW